VETLAVAEVLTISASTRPWRDLQVAVVGVGDVVRAADRCERRRTVAAATTFDVGGRRKNDALGPEWTEYRLTRI